MTKQANQAPIRPKVLVVDDEPSIRTMIATALEMGEEYEVFQASTGAQARDILSQHTVDVAITDLILPDDNGLELLEWAQASLPGTTWIILSGRGKFDDAVRAVHLGAFDFMVKPLPAIDSLLVTVRNALRQRQLEQEQQRLHLDIEERNVRLREQVAQLRDACQLLGEQAQIIQDDLRRAELIQRALLPRVSPDLGHFSINALYRPSSTVGGDIYECLRMDYRFVLGYIADAAGHGVSAAMLAVLFKHRLHMTDEMTNLPTPPARVLELVGRDLLGECRAPGLFVTACYFILDLEDLRLTIASAGHPPAFLHRRDGRVEAIYHTGPALGISPDARYAQKTFHLGEGDRLLLYTDGLLESATERIELDRIAEKLSDPSHRGQPLLQDFYRMAMGSRTEDHLPDDVTLLLLALDRGESVLDNGHITPAQAHREVPRGDAQVLMGTEDNTTALAVMGRGTWTHSSTFHDACTAAIEDNRQLLIDLSMCTYLDSTFLGTMQEIVDLARRRGSDICVQSPLPEVRRQFEELGMQQVSGCMADGSSALPTNMLPLAGSQQMDQQQGLRMLRAHEVLSQLNDRNRGEFLKLIEALRKEMGRPGG